MAAIPRVLDLAGRARGTTVEVVASPLTELLIGLQTFQFRRRRAPAPSRRRRSTAVSCHRANRGRRHR